MSGNQGEKDGAGNMSLDRLLIETLSALAPVEQGQLTSPPGRAAPSTYYITNYATVPVNYGDDAPDQEKYLIQVHLFCPVELNSLSTRKKTKQHLHSAGFSWPAETNAGIDHSQSGSAGKQHHIFECEWVEGVDLDG